MSNDVNSRVAKAKHELEKAHERLFKIYTRKAKDAKKE